jgi:hypothetical protein
MHAFKFKRYGIKWNPRKRKFFKKKRNRQASRKAYMRWKRNRSKMKSALRRSKAKRKRAMRRNRARGIYKKLSVARKRFKSILKHDVEIDDFINILNEKEKPRAEIVLEPEDLDGVKEALRDLRDNLEFDNDDVLDVLQFIEDSEELIDGMGGDELEEEDLDALEEIIAMIDDYAEKIGIYGEEDKE